MAGTITGLLKYKEQLYHCKDENLLLQEQLQAAEEALRRQGIVKPSLPDAPEEFISGEEPSEGISPVGIPSEDEVSEADVTDDDIDQSLRLLFKRMEQEIISKNFSCSRNCRGRS